MQNADKEFVQSLFSLIRNIKRAIELHQDLSANVHSPAELMTGTFNGIKVIIFLYINRVTVRDGVSNIT